MKIRTVILILFALVLASGASAQKKTKIVITGTVTNASGIPLTNAIIMIDGQNTSSVTDDNGKYRVKVNQNAEKIGVMTFTNGFIEQPINGRTEINFNFSKPGLQQADQKGNAAPGEEGVNTGYSHLKAKDVTSNINKVDGTGKKYYKYTDIYDMITRENAGVRVVGGQILIQDSKDLQGSVYALLVVDGVAVESIESILPSSVESIEILKGSSAAMYGTRGYGGVVLIKTKKKIE